MKERPILFSAPMVRALLDGSKTQTRRIMKSQPYTLRTEGFGYPTKAGGFVSLQSEHCLNECPYGKPGDRLWVREGFWSYGGKPRMFRVGSTGAGFEDKQFSAMQHVFTAYRADWKDQKPTDCERWKPGIHMPRTLSRITLEITEVRVERLKDISEEDAIAEGLHIQIGDARAGHMWNGPGYHDYHSFDRHGSRTYHVGTIPGGICICNPGQKLRLTPAKCAYRILWESINGAGSWDANPWAWAISFKRLSA